MSLGKRALIATAWASLSNYVGFVGGFILSILLARVLSPHEFGQMALANVFLDFLYILTAWSFQVAIIQHRGDLNEILPTSFALTFLVGGGVALLAILSAPLLGQFYDPVVIQIFVLLAVTGVLNLFAFVFRGVLEKELEYKKIAAVELAIMLLPPTLSLGLAVQGWGVWSLAAGQVFFAVLQLVGMAYLSGVRFRVGWHRQMARHLMHFGASMLGSRALDVVFTRFDNFVVGSSRGTIDLGLYNRAYTSSELGARFLAPAIISVALPVYAKVQTSRAHMTQAYETVMFFLIRVLAPLFLILTLFPTQVVVLLYGEQWRPAAPALGLLGLYAVLKPMYDSLRQLLYANGVPQEVLKVQFTQSFVFVTTLLLLVYWFGIIGAALSIEINALLGVVFLLGRAARYVDLRLKENVVAPVVAVATSMLGFAVWAAYGGVALRGLGQLFEFVGVISLYLIVLILLDRKRLNSHWAYLSGVIRDR